MPFEKACLTSSDVTDVAPTEYRADAVVTLTVEDTPVRAVVIEVQLRTDARKRRTWPAYVGTLYARLDCPVVLLVIAPEPRVAAWCARPTLVGEPGFVLTPVVLGPTAVPLVTDADSARRNPELTVLSAMAHASGHDQKPLLEALLIALAHVDHVHATLYADVVLKVLPAAARDLLEALMTTSTHPPVSDFARRWYDDGKAEGKAEGNAEGEARAVLAVLDARGLPVPDGVRSRIATCTDLGQLDAWIRRAVTITDVEELFD